MCHSFVNTPLIILKFLLEPDQVDGNDHERHKNHQRHGDALSHRAYLLADGAAKAQFKDVHGKIIGAPISVKRTQADLFIKDAK